MTDKFTDQSTYAKNASESNSNLSEVGHTVLDVTGFVPVVGEAADIANAIWYATEGRYLESGLSLISLIPLVGDVIGKGGKLATKLGPLAQKKLISLLAKIDVSKFLSQFKNHPKLGRYIDNITKALEEWKQVLNKKFSDTAPKGTTECPTLKEGVPTPKTRAADDLATRDQVQHFNPKPQAQQAVKNYDAGKLGNSAKELGPELSKLDREQLYTRMKQELDAKKCEFKSKPLANGDPQYIFEYPDGTVVRLKPKGDKFRLGRTYSIEVKHNPALPDQGPQSIAFKVDSNGNPVPKGPSDMQVPSDLTGPDSENYIRSMMDAGHRSAQ